MAPACEHSSARWLGRKVFEKISGMTLTPTFSDLAVRKGEELNLGSSPMEILSAESEPLKERKAQIAEFDFAAERGGSFFFNGGAELIDGNQKTARREQEQPARRRR